MTWLSQLDPNVLVGIAVSLGAWIYHRVNGQQTASFDDTIKGIGKQVVDQLVKSGLLDVDKLNALATKLMTDAATKLGIPTNSITTALIQATAQHAVGDALEEIRSFSDQADTDLQKIRDVAASMNDTIAKAQAAGAALVAPMAGMIERVPADPVAITPSTVASGTLPDPVK